MFLETTEKKLHSIGSDVNDKTSYFESLRQVLAKLLQKIFQEEYFSQRFLFPSAIKSLRKSTGPCSSFNRGQQNRDINNFDEKHERINNTKVRARAFASFFQGGKNFLNTTPNPTQHKEGQNFAVFPPTSSCRALAELVKLSLWCIFGERQGKKS